MDKYKITYEYKDCKDKLYIVYVIAGNTREAIVKAVDLYGINDLRHKFISCELVYYKEKLTIL